MKSRPASPSGTEVKIKDSGETCPRCSRGFVMEVYLDGQLVSFYCGNASGCCGVRFAVEVERPGGGERRVYYGVPYNPDFPVGVLVMEGAPDLRKDLEVDGIPFLLKERHRMKVAGA